MNKIDKLPNATVRAVLEKSSSWVGAARELVVDKRSLKRRAITIGAKMPNMRGRAWNKKGNPVYVDKLILDDILIKNSTYSNPSRLKEKLLESGLKSNTCNQCGVSSWQGSPVPLVVRTRNGVERDYRIKNVMLVCLNCEHIMVHGKKIKNKV